MTIQEILKENQSGTIPDREALLLIGEANKSRGQRAYELRRMGMNWKKIGAAMGGIGSSYCLRLAENYAVKSGQQWPLPKMYIHQDGFSHCGKESYNMKSVGITWTEIAARLGVTRQAVQQSAAYYAKRNNLPQHRKLVLELGGVYYKLRLETSMTWTQIAEQHGKSQPNIWQSARNYATKNNLTWPI